MRAATIRGLSRSPSAGVFSEVNEAFTPRSLPNLAAWFDALDTRTMLSGDGSTITDGGAVALWGDKSGNSGVNALVMAGGSGNRCTVADAAGLRVTGDIDIIAYARLASWASGAAQVFVSKNTGAAGTYSYAFYISATGALILAVSLDGTSILTPTSTANVSFAAYQDGYIRVTRASATGNVNFYTSSNGSTWSLLGSANVSSTAGTINPGTGDIHIGSQGTGFVVSGSIFRAIVKDGIAGTAVLDVDFALAGKKLANNDTFTATTGGTVTLNSSGATGARIAGERDLYQGTLASRPVYLAYSGTKYGWLNATAGNYFSTPDSAAVSITGDIDMRIYINAPDWTPAADMRLISKRSATPAISYDFVLRTTGGLQCQTSADGATAITSNSTATVSFADGANGWVRVTVDVDNGAGGNTVTFYTSTDGTTWSQLGDPVVNVGTTSIYDSNVALEVGSRNGGSASNLAARVYRAQIYNAIGAVGGNPLITIGPDATDASRKADFNPALYTSGTTFTASTGEVWTINGGATIVTRTGLYFDGSNDYLKTAAFSLSQPETVYLTTSQVSWTLNDVLFDGNASGNNGQIYQSNTTPKLSLYAGSVAAEISTLAVAICGALCAVFNGASSLLRLNRGAAATGNAGVQAMNGLILGAAFTPTAYANEFISEVAIYSAAHATATQDRMALYAGRRHGFSA